MDPHIQYCRTADGVSIAYARDGAGQPFVSAPNMWSSIELTGSLPEMLRRNRARGMETILLDARGTGASQRDVAGISLETRLLDIEAVVDHLSLAPFVLLGISHGGPPAIRYAARHPDRVAALILSSTYASGASYYRLAPVMRAFASIEHMARDQWEYYTKAAANMVVGFSDPALAERLAMVYRDSVTPETLVQYREASRLADVSEELEYVQCPTLVLDDRKSELSVAELSRQLASGIPGARLVSIEAGIVGGEALHRAIDDFLGTSSVPAVTGVTAAGAGAAALTVILFADIADSTALTERMGDAAFRSAARALDDRMRTAISEAGGSAIEGKVLGDGVMAVFASAAQAIAAAARCHAASAEVDLPLHIGLHAGDVIREEGNVFGGAVNIASRVCALCLPGEILVSATVRDLARTSAGVTFEDRGEQALKGVGEPVRVFAVRAQPL